MQAPTKLSAALLAGIIIAAGFVSIAWFQAPGTSLSDQNGTDTLPKREKKVRKEKEKHHTVITGDLDQNLEQLDKAIDKLDRQMEGKDWDKVNEQLRESVEKIDAEKIERQIEAAMKNIDLDKIRLETDAALKKVDWDKMQQDIRRAMTDARNSFDSNKFDAELQQALEQSRKAMAEVKNIDMDKVRAEMDRAREELREQQGKIREELEHAQKEMRENGRHDMKKELQKAKEGVQRAKEELKEYKAMLGEMEKDGLINTKENYTIEYKDGDLFINGKKQSDSTRDKYRHYFKKDNIKIKKERDGDDEDDDSENDNDNDSAGEFI